MDSTFCITSTLDNRDVQVTKFKVVIKHTIIAGHHGKPPNLHQTISPGSYKSALVSAESTDCEGFAFGFSGVRFAALAATVGSVPVSSAAVAAGLSNINCGSCCFERRGRLVDGDSKV